MKKFSRKSLNWNKKKARKEAEKRRKSNRSKRLRLKSVNDVQSRYIRKTHILKAPAVVSLLNEAKTDTLSFLSESIKTIDGCKVDEEIYFDLSNVEQITADAVMYLIALINNVKRVQILKIPIRGNLPNNIDARKFIAEIGFYNFVGGVKPKNYEREDRFRISRGEKTDGKLVGKLCDFVLRDLKPNSAVSTRQLYPMIIELMTNTGQHAYNSSISAKMNSNWYIFAEKKDKSVHFVFLDTGVGIPTTIRYSFLEKSMNILFDNDAAYIASALRGEQRTETGKSYRGKGLPGIFNDAREGFVKTLTIISGKGQCIIEDDGTIAENILEDYFEGTLFSWYFGI